MIDDEPTPIDPPSFDLAALDSEAARAPQAAEQPRPFGSRLPHDQERFLNYLVLGKHAEGGLSLIYELAHLTTRERVALKILKPERRNDPMHVKRLLAEGQLLMSIKHDNLCPVMDVGTHPDLGPYFLMPMLRGNTLGEYLRSENAKGRALPIKVALEIVITVAEVLQLMHQRGAINRDLKPDNIFIVRHADGTQTPKVIDWGAGKTDFSPRSTQAPSVVTPLYMAPEQADSSKYPITGATDQYALGVITLELIADHPYRDRVIRGGLRLGDLIAMILHAPLPRPAPHLVPPALTDILMRATAKDPAQRYGSMTELAEALRGFLKSGWQLGARPAALDRAERATALTERARQHAQKELAKPEARKRPATPPTPVRRVALDEACAKPTLLVLHPGELRGQRFELGPTGTIGRHPAYASLVLDHESVSNEHLEYACVQHDGERPIYSFENLTPGNPAFLAGTPVEAGPWAQNQVLELGDVKMLLMPACAVAPDLASFTPISNAAALERSSASAARTTGASQRRQRRAIAEADTCSRPTLMILKPESLRGKRFELGARGIIGRLPDVADIVVDHRSVSASHLEYTLVTAGNSRTDRTVYELRDLASSNGSYMVVGDLIDGPDELRKLERGYANGMDRIKLGDCEVILLPAGQPDGHIDRWIYPGESEEERQRAEAAIAGARRAKILKRWDDERKGAAGSTKQAQSVATEPAKQEQTSVVTADEGATRRATIRYLVAGVFLLALLILAASIWTAHQRGLL